MERLSSYVLTKNSETHLYKILEALSQISDEIIVLDSGSSDRTETIARSFGCVKFVYRAFTDFKDQRSFAASVCGSDMILFLDSDEIPDDDFIESVRKIKDEGFVYDAYKINRRWNVLGKDIHCIYPITSPDGPVRLYRKSKVSFSNSNLVHESLSGFDACGEIGGSVNHITFTTRLELNAKLDFYTDIACLDLLKRGKRVDTLKIVLSPLSAFFKWYFVKGGYKDGKIGWLLGVYAYGYTRKKYIKARRSLHDTHVE